MADFLDELIGLQKEFKAITADIEAETADLRGATVTGGGPVWAPGDYKVVPKANAAMCVRCKFEDASCDLCEQVCPTDAIRFTDDGDIEITNDCRKCGLCVAVCPTDALLSSLYGPRTIYDKICKAAEANEMVYVTCTRALGARAPRRADRPALRGRSFCRDLVRRPVRVRQRGGVPAAPYLREVQDPRGRGLLHRADQLRRVVVGRVGGPRDAREGPHP